MSSVSAACKSYFQGFQDLHCDKRCDPTKNTLGFLKILTYFTIVIPLSFAIIYSCSALVGRICPQRHRRPIDREITNLSQKRITIQSTPVVPTPAQPIAPPVSAPPVKVGIEAELEEFFKSKKKCQKLFIIEGENVGIVFDPSGGKIEFPPVTVTDFGTGKEIQQSGSRSSSPIVIIYDNSKTHTMLPRSVESKIASKLPRNYKVDMHIVGKKHLLAYGFIGTDTTNAPAPTFTKAFLE